MDKKITVVKVLDADRVVINAGKAQGISRGDKFFIYKLDEEILDPDTGESLGHLEIPRGYGVVDYVQDKMAQVKSTKTKIRKKETHPALGMLGIYGKSLEEEVLELPFDFPEEGDVARLIGQKAG